MKIDYGKGAKRGRLLAQGRGWHDMMDVCYQHKWDNDNTILVVSNANNLDSKWYIYEKKGESNENV